MIAHYTNEDALTVKKLLGYERIENTMKYIDTIDFKNDDSKVATATSDERHRIFQKYDGRKISEACISYYRRPKRLSK